MIEEYFERYGWQYNKIEDNLWATDFKVNDEINQPILISLQDEIISFEVSLPIQNKDVFNDPKMTLLLLRMNHEWPFIKIGLNADQDEVFISLDCLNRQFSFDVFETLFDLFVEGTILLYEAFFSSVNPNSSSQ